jgi:hypothetical protein
MEWAVMDLVVCGNSSSGVVGVVPTDLFFQKLVLPVVIAKFWVESRTIR